MLTDGRGCYEAHDLPVDEYRITARVTGFDNITRDQLMIVPGEVERVNFTMRISTICECLAPPTTLSGRYRQAGAVVHARIIRSDNALSSPPGYITQTAEIIEVFKRHPSGGPVEKVFRFQQNQSSGTSEPYEVGQELVLFLGWWGNSKVFSEVSVNAFVMTVTRVTSDLLGDLRRLRR